MNPLQLPEAAIRDTVAAVFSDPAFRRSTLLQRIGAWLLDVLEAILHRLRPGGATEPLFWVVAGLIGILLLGLLLRTLLLIRADRRARPGSPGRGSVRGAADAWALSSALAAAGDFTGAAHALYAATVQSIAGRGEIEIHESKTIGDYSRELGKRRSRWLAGFRDFARSYETVIYGLGWCDRERYERLHRLARPLVESGG